MEPNRAPPPPQQQQQQPGLRDFVFHPQQQQHNIYSLPPQQPPYNPLQNFQFPQPQPQQAPQPPPAQQQQQQPYGVPGISGPMLGPPPPITQQVQQQVLLHQQAGTPGAVGQGSRKRPKYTRSKAGCLTCRTKKIKCDELHPICTRCMQSHRECIWPPEPSSARRSKPDSLPTTPGGSKSVRSAPYPTSSGHKRNLSSTGGHTVDSRSHSPQGSTSGSEGRGLGSASPVVGGGGAGGQGQGQAVVGKGANPNNAYSFDPSILPLLSAMASLQQRSSSSSTNPTASLAGIPSPDMPPLPTSPPHPTSSSNSGNSGTTISPALPTPYAGASWGAGVGASPQIHNSALKFVGGDGEWFDPGVVFGGGWGGGGGAQQGANGDEEGSGQGEYGMQVYAGNGNGALSTTPPSAGSTSGTGAQDYIFPSYFPPPSPLTNTSTSTRTNTSLAPTFSLPNTAGQPYPFAGGLASPPPLDSAFVAQLAALQSGGYGGSGGASGISPAQGQWGQTLLQGSQQGMGMGMGGGVGQGGYGQDGMGGGGPMSQPLMVGPDPFEPYFQTVEERNLIRHYCSTATKIIMAVPSDLNPVLAINLPLVFEHPPGTNAATEALRLSLLGVGAIHQAYLLSRHGVNQASQQEMMNLALTLRLTATHYLRMACLTAQGMESDAALGASVTIALIDIFTGGQGWTANLALAKTLVDLRGGPRAIIATNQPQMVDGGARVSPARLLLEILAVYDTFGSLTTGEPPTILGPGSEDWWFDGDKSSYHLFSVEKVFGMSRAMIELVARVSGLASRATKHRRKIVELSSASASSSLSPNDDEEEDERSERETIEAEALALYEETRNWTDPASRYRLHHRVENGNTAHRQAMQIILLRDVLRVERHEQRVQEAASSILRLCSESAKKMGMGVDLTWPVIVAGCQVDPEEYDMVLKTFEGFRDQCCFDIDTAEKIVKEVWKRFKENPNDPRADWRSVTEDLDMRVLLL